MQEHKYVELLANKGEGNLNRKAEGIMERKKGAMVVTPNRLVRLS
jgi:hypothetical protein